MAPSEHAAGSGTGDADGEKGQGREPAVPEPLQPHIAEIRALLTADRERTADRIASLTGDLTSIIEAAQLTATDDEHDPEGSSTAFERSHTNALLTAAESHLADVDRALGRITDGDYGLCERCGAPISPERLLARPAARTCIACAARDTGGRR